MTKCYNGAWDSKAQAQFEREDQALTKLRRSQPSAHCTWFPLEEMWLVHVWGKPLSGFHSRKIDALNEANAKAETGK